MFRKSILALSVLFLTVGTSIHAKDNFSDVDVSRLLQDYFDYKTTLDSISLEEVTLNDYADDLMENHPADDLYRNIWTSESLNPYKYPIDSINDSIRIDCAEFVLPVPGHVTSKFGPRRYRYHYGIDLKAYVGDPVQAAFSGKIRIIDYEKKGYGHYVVIRHNNGLETVYGHLSKVLVEHNQIINAGDTIALAGNTGRSTGPHLHFEFRYMGNPLDPAKIVDFKQGELKENEYFITRNETFNYHRDVQALKSALYVTVRSGDTLGQIASRNGTSVNSLCQLNKISSKSIIRPGQKLRVR